MTIGDRKQSGYFRLQNVSLHNFLMNKLCACKVILQKILDKRKSECNHFNNTNYSIVVFVIQSVKLLNIIKNIYFMKSICEYQFCNLKKNSDKIELAPWCHLLKSNYHVRMCQLFLGKAQKSIHLSKLFSSAPQ